MKIVVTSTGRDLDAALDPRFGRCPYFALIETESGVLEAAPNPFLDATGGAGTQAAQWVVEQGAGALLTGHCGPKAATVLQDAGVRTVEGASGTVREAVDRIREEERGTFGQPGRWHAGGQGAGRGRGTGGGRGAGKGQGAGGGRGAGKGQGAGGGRGAGRGQGTGGGLGSGGRS